MEHDAGLRLAQNWTWGGSVIRGEDGLYHMFVMHLVERCGIQCCNEPQLQRCCAVQFLIL
jgi:hypothetical protein